MDENFYRQKPSLAGYFRGETEQALVRPVPDTISVLKQQEGRMESPESSEHDQRIHFRSVTT